jgi:hypothetical protein
MAMDIKVEKLSQEELKKKEFWAGRYGRKKFPDFLIKNMIDAYLGY